MILERQTRTLREYSISAMQPQFVDTVLLKTLVDRLVALGVIGEIDRFEIYSDAAAAVEQLPGDNIDMIAELIMLADAELDERGELKANGKV